MKKKIDVERELRFFYEQAVDIQEQAQTLKFCIADTLKILEEKENDKSCK